MHKIFKVQETCQKSKGERKGVLYAFNMKCSQVRYFTGWGTTVLYVAHLSLETESDSISSNYFFVAMRFTFGFAD